MGCIHYSPQVVEDLQTIKNYISLNFGDEVAEKKLRKLTKDILDKK